MNPIFDPGTSGPPQFAPGTNPSLFTGLASTGGDPGTVGGNNGQLAQTPGTNTATGGGSVPQEQFALRDQSTLGKQTPGMDRPVPGGGAAPSGWNWANLNALQNWDPAMHPGRRRPTPSIPGAGHQGPAGMDWSRYNMGGNMGNSAMGAQGNYRPVDSVGDYPWMTDKSTQWGGGPFGYLPINYQPQAFSYYNQPGVNYAPWETKYANDTWTQNYNRDDPGFINTNRLANNPNYGANLRG